MPNQYPTLECVDALKPTYGLGKMAMCRQCVETQKQDVANRIAAKVHSMCLPSGVMDDELHDLLKLWEGQRNG